jgi:RNA polymerase sigma factor (sigma-70 family)
MDTMTKLSSVTTLGAAQRVFPHTRWSLVLAATRKDTVESAAALEFLCRAYWYPLYAFARRSGQSAHDAQDLTQGFFCRLLERHWLDSADREKGKLRTFLIVAFKNFMSKEWRRASAQRRGGGQAQVALDTEFAESRFAADPSAKAAPEETFDQQWAMTLLDLTLNRLQAEFVAAGKPDDFESLKGCLMAGRGAIDYPQVAARLGVNEGAARVAVHRLRKKFREAYREEISRTLTEDADLDEEIRYLAGVLASK